MEFYWTLWYGFLTAGLGVIPVLLFIPAPYGKFTRAGWGPQVSGRISWMLQESPCCFYAIYYLVMTKNLPTEQFILLVIFSMQYYQRAFVYGYLMSAKSITTLPVVLSAIFFNLVNGYLQCGGITEYDPISTGLYSVRFCLGILIWACGSLSNIYSDHLLRCLRKPGESGYKIPQGGLFEYVSAANYFTESIMWLGWAIACSNWSGWLFLFMTVSNLFPRALSQHKFYLENFKEYQKLGRKAYIPYII